jgi:glycosyltransferase involved in cell wall biosynthesis
VKSCPLVSVIVNCHNGEKYLANCIKSILNQRFRNFEIIFWDNCSSDSSKKIINGFKDKRIKKFFSTKFVKLYSARNQAVKKSNGKYLSFLDVDDLWKSNKLSEQIKVLKKKKDIKIVYSNYIYHNVKKRKKFLKFKSKLPSGFITQDLLNDYKIGILTTIVEKKLFKKYNFNPSYDIIGDFDFFIRASVFNKIVSIQKPLAQYRVHDSNLSIKKNDIYQKEISNWIMKTRNDKFLKSFNYFNLKKLLFKLKIKYFLFKYLKIYMGV